MPFEDHPCIATGFVDHETGFGDPQTDLTCMDDPQTEPEIAA
jgi:hypothetical protein